jgi:hypothetical protein
VAVVKVEVPKKARVGDAIAINVRVRNTRYPETVGQLRFKAVATIIDHRDALPGDNELISPLVKIT